MLCVLGKRRIKISKLANFRSYFLKVLAFTLILLYFELSINQEKSPSQINENFLTRANQILKAQNPNFKRQVSVSLNDVYVTRNFFQKIPLQKIKTVKSALVLLALKVS